MQMHVRVAYLWVILAVVYPSQESRIPRQAAETDRLGCNGDSVPPTRYNSTQNLLAIRRLMSNKRVVRQDPVQAYIIPSTDEHQSEYTSLRDSRRAFVSGFTGSVGTAIVTMDAAALWTDNRYYLQADQQLDCNWLLMKEGLDNVPTIAEWLRSVLKPNDTVGADPKLVGAGTWLQLEKELSADDSKINLRSVSQNLVDMIWTNADGRPPVSNATVYVHALDFAGQSWLAKLHSLRRELTETGSDAMIVSALDEIAWLFNLRGGDVEDMPVFYSYAFISEDQAILYVNEDKVTDMVRKHLESVGCSSADCVQIRNYGHIWLDLPRLVQDLSFVLIPSEVAYTAGSSYAIYQTIPEAKRSMGPSPIVFLKAKKNIIEVRNMKSAHLKDAVALCDFMSLLEKEVQEGKEWDELKVVEELQAYRSQQLFSKGPSFGTIAAFGANGAVIHYSPTPESNVPINNSTLFLLDSGGQYFDGTTDVTRTFHFGSPTSWQKETYTRVLMGQIDLAMLVFPEGTEDSKIDVVARSHLFNIGLDYRHGTGHGIGAFLGVHESPTRVRIYSNNPYKLEENYFLSNEPGYYEENNFGIRLENVMRVIHQNTPNEFDGRYFAFETITMVPYEPNLIMTELLSVKHRKWLNEYNAVLRTKVGEELKKQNRMRGFYWLMSKTGHIFEGCNGSAGFPPSRGFMFAVVFTAISLCLPRFYF